LARRVMGTYLLQSIDTGRTYLSERREGYLFRLKSDAVSFSGRMARTCVADISRMSMREICSMCYADGAETLWVSGLTGRNPRCLKLKDTELARRYYNGHLTADISRLLTTHRMLYLADMANCHFLVPVRIRGGPSPVIDYASVQPRGRSDGAFRYLAFTDLAAFDAWAEAVPGWEPLQVTAAGLVRIGGSHGFLIDPFGCRFVLTGDMLKLWNIPEKEEED